MARSTWTGAITFGIMPIAVKAYSLHASSSKGGFKTLCDCHGEPITQTRNCQTTGKEVPNDRQRKGVEVSKGVFRALPEATVNAIESSQRSVALDIELVCPMGTVDLRLSTGAYVLSPDGDAHAKVVEALRLVLAKLDLALITRWVPRAGSKDAILVIHAGDGDLLANTLPFAYQLNDAPTPVAGSVMVADAELAMLETALTTLYTNGPFDITAFASDHNARRAKAIEQALAGQTIDAPAAAPAAPAVPDLMAALQASLAAVKTTPDTEAAAA